MNWHAFHRVVALLAFLAAVSCARETVPPPPELYWPLPPERPRIKFVDVVIGSLDAEIRFSKIKDYVFGESGEYRFQKPFGVAARNGVMYVTDLRVIHKFDFVNKKFRMFGQPNIAMPSAIDVAPDGRVFVGDVVRHSVLVFDGEEKQVGEIGTSDLGVPAGIAVDGKRGRLIVSDSRKHRIFVYTLEGRLEYSFGGRGISEGKLNVPYGVDVDPAGRIYVVDSANFRLQVFSPEGRFIKSFGYAGDVPGAFARPKGVAVDSDGNIYVLDAAFANFQIFDFDGNTLLAVGSPGQNIGEFLLPSSIYIDEKDQIYVVDQVNRRVQIFQYLR